MKLNRLITLLLAATLFAIPSHGQTQTPIDIDLWPNGATEKNADEGKACDESQQIFQPSIRVFLPEGRRTGRAVVICPGGGYYTLASTLATHYPQELKPAFQILFYPVISMDTTITHQGSRDNLIGQNPDPQLVDCYSNELQVDAETPRAFIALSDDDNVVPVENSLRYYTALHRHHVPVSLHIYPTGGHGWGYQETFRFKNEVHSALADWLRSF